MDDFLKHVSGVVHVGANTGQERELYRRHGLRVVWVEAIPEVFRRLQDNLKGIEEQIAIEALVTDRSGHEYTFNVSNNDGLSSSILALKHHKDIWPQVSYARVVKLFSTTLDELFEKHDIDASGYQALVLDTQGSELLVLKGAEAALHNFAFIKTEVADFEAYEGCCQLRQIRRFLKEHGYREVARRKFAGRAGGGSYFDVVYRRR